MLIRTVAILLGSTSYCQKLLIDIRPGKGLHADNTALQSRLCLHGCVLAPLTLAVAIDGRHQSTKWQFLAGVNQVAGGQFIPDYPSPRPITQQSQIRDWPNKHYSKRPWRCQRGIHVQIPSSRNRPSPPLAHQPRFLCRGRTTVSSEVLESVVGRQSVSVRRQRVIILAGCQTEERAATTLGSRATNNRHLPPFSCPSQLCNCISQLYFLDMLSTVFSTNCIVQLYFQM